MKRALDIIEAYEEIKEITRTYRNKEKKLILALPRYFNSAKELQNRLVALYKCHGLHQGSNIIAMLQLIILVNITEEMLQYHCWTTSFHS